MFFCENHEYPEVVDDRIDTLQFLEASRGVVKFVELLGRVFTPVRSDINGNIEKLHAIYVTDKEKFSTLNGIVEHELTTKTDVGIDALLWLKRALEYTQSFLISLLKDYKEGIVIENLTPHFSQAYENTLYHYHSWMIQKLFGLILLAAPSRKTLIQLLCNKQEDATEEDVFKDIEGFLEGLSNNLTVINKLYSTHNFDSKP